MLVYVVERLVIIIYPFLWLSSLKPFTANEEPGDYPIHLIINNFLNKFFL